MSYLQRVAERVDSFYVDLAAQSLYHPEREANPSRTRWKFLQRRIKDGSFFVLTRDMAPISLDQPIRAASSFESKRSKRQSISFDHVLSQAVTSVAKANKSGSRRAGGGRSPSTIREEDENGQVMPLRPRRLADAHTDRARGGNHSTSNEDQITMRSANKMSQFMSGKMKDIRRLSKTNDMLSLENAMAIYGHGGPGSRIDEDSEEDVSPTRMLPPVPPLPYEHRRMPSRQESLDRLTGVRGPSSERGGMGTRTPPRYEGSEYGSSGRSGHSVKMPSRYEGSEYGGTMRHEDERSVRRPMPKSDMQNATFSRKLSMYRPNGGSNAGSRMGDETSPLERPPPVPVKPSHW